MGKKILFGLLVLTGRFLFAQETPRPVLSAENLRGLIDNWDGIVQALGELEDTPQKAVFLEDFVQFIDQFQEFFEGNESNNQEFKNAFMKMRDYKVSPQIKAVFYRYGLGPRGFEVFFISIFGSMTYAIDRMMSPLKGIIEFAGELDSTGEMRLIFDRLEILKGLIHPQDMALIGNFYEELRGIMPFIDTEGV